VVSEPSKDTLKKSLEKNICFPVAGKSLDLLLLLDCLAINHVCALLTVILPDLFLLG